MTTFECNIVAPMPELTASFDQYIDYSEYHLLAANNAMVEAEKIEIRFALTKKADELKNHMAYVSSCVMCCVAALESKINERVFLHKNNIDKIQINIDPIAQKIFPKLKIVKLSQHILDITSVSTKYDILWHLSNKCYLPNSPFKENLEYLANLRNSLTHYTPEWRSESKQHKKLQNSRKNKFTLNPFYPDGKETFFPFSLMSASCAKWALQTCQEALQRLPNLNG
jgi:hypothetical protein